MAAIGNSLVTQKWCQAAYTLPDARIFDHDHLIIQALRSLALLPS
jgi:hypothetical protein